MKNTEGQLCFNKTLYKHGQVVICGLWAIDCHHEKKNLVSACILYLEVTRTSAEEYGPRSEERYRGEKS